MARYKRMRGYNVLFPQGWHATGGPIMAAALRVREGDPKQIEILRMMGIEDSEIPKFRDPEHWVRFFTKAWKEDFQRYGLSIDWRREFYTTYLNPPYSKFVQWQYLKLRKLGLITKGRHPVVWCPKERKVVGDHDRPDEYVGIVPEEVVIIKFEGKDGTVYPCLTYRPETVYGAVNIWVNPSAEYIVADVKGERWVLAPNAVEELRDQGLQIKARGRISGSRLVGRRALNPATGLEVPVLPADFVDPELGTGVVMSVPAHAPHDYVALMDLKRRPQILEKYGVPPSILERMEPVSIIRLEGFGEYPAAQIVERMGIRSQRERGKLEKATREIYTKEYYNGVLKEIFGKYAGRTVSEAKEELVDDFVKRGFAIKHWTLPREVYCRCGARTHVKIVEDQWFLRYSDRGWKEKAHRCVDRMKFLPPELREFFHRQIDWYQDWACTHKGELGAPLPWDPEWVLESLSDSTIYMAYYTISKYLQHPDAYNISWEKIGEEFFDYVFLGVGDPEKVASEIGIARDLLEAMREEFLYWYPVDLRISGKDLLPNHLVFFVMHHVAIFPPHQWPRGIGVNGWVLVGGKKMSKSLGNFITLRQALDIWGADATRFAEAYAGDSGLDDANFEPEFADRAVDILYDWYRFAVDNYGRGREERLEIDRWFESVLNRTILEVEQHIERTDFKTALVRGFFELQNEFRWYLRRSRGNPNRDLLRKFIEWQTLILAPFTPHIAEEIWERIGKQGLISFAEWPRAEKDKIDEEVERAELIVREVLKDSREIMRLLKTKPAMLKVILADGWKYSLASNIARLLDEGCNLRVAIKRALSADYGADRKILQKVVSRYARDQSLLNLVVSPESERESLLEAGDFLEDELGIKVVILQEKEAEEPKARMALPGKPALVVS